MNVTPTLATAPEPAVADFASAALPPKGAAFHLGATLRLNHSRFRSALRLLHEG